MFVIESFAGFELAGYILKLCDQTFSISNCISNKKPRGLNGVTFCHQITSCYIYMANGNLAKVISEEILQSAPNNSILNSNNPT